MCGRARQGKSYILNRIAERAAGAQPGAGGGFTVAATQKPCTKGIWLWSKPVARKAADGSRRARRGGRLARGRALSA